MFPQFCLCGAEPSYPHAADCPYPLFRCNQTQQRQWEQARQNREALLIAAFEAEQERQVRSIAEANLFAELGDFDNPRDCGNL